MTSTDTRGRRARNPFRRGTPPTFDPSLEFFSGLTRRQLDRAAQLFTILTVEPGKVLGREGRVGREFVVVLTGQVGVSLHGDPLAVLESGHHFGALPLLDPLKGTARRASFHVLAPGTIAVANRAEFSTLLKEVPLIDARIRALAEKRDAYFRGVAGGRRVEAAADPRYPVGVSVDA